jgi:hypothetical protein
MAYYDPISENDESTVVSEFEQGFFAAEAPYMSESNLEDQFVEQLRMQAYEYLRVTTEDELIVNLRRQLEQLNGVTFNDSEWKRFFATNIAKPNSGIIDKTRVIQEDPRFTFTFDNGDMMNTRLLHYAGEIRSAVLIIHGEKAHSRYFSEYAFEKMTGKNPDGKSMTIGNKELMIIPDAVHTDLYDDKNGKIPYDKIEAFFRENLK